MEYHLQLHSLKVMEGRQIHGVVQEALDKYFASLRPDAPEAKGDTDADAEETGVSR